MYALINGVEYDAETDFSITEQAGNKTSSTFNVVVYDQPTPKAGDVFELQADDGTTLFLGTCGIPRSPKYETGLEKRVYKIVCGNANSILSYRIVNVAYQGLTVTEIVQNLFNRYISEEGITLGQISSVDVTLDVYTAADYNLQDALNELADLVGAVWQVSNDRVFDFIVRADFPAFPQVIDADFLIGTAYQHTTKDYKVRTVQYVTGATDSTTQQTEIYTWDGEARTITVSFPIAQKPSISINGTPVPSNQIGVNGIDDENPDIVFAWSYDSQVITIKQQSALASGDTIQVSYIGMFPIRVVSYNAPKIAEVAEKTGTSGKKEMVQLATDITTTADALQLAQSLLQQYDEATGELSLWLLSSQLYASGMTLDDVSLLTKMTFDLPQFGIVGEFVICERKLSLHTAADGNYWENLKIELLLRDRNLMKSSGEVISNLYRNVNQLTIRQDDIVIEQQVISETLSEDEELIASVSIPAFCSGGPSIFLPQSLSGTYYPTPWAEYSGEIDTPPTFYPSSGTDIFDPPLGEAFPI